MINQVDITSFGSFKDLEWKKTVRDSGQTIQNFKRLNILYGRNYSGKTTLSRVFRALEMRKIPPSYLNVSFNIHGERGNVTQLTLPTHDYDIRVYNRDFVADNLSFLVNQVDGEIKTFAIVGEKNKTIDDEIEAIESNLGSIESKSGLRFELETKKQARDRISGNHKTTSDSLEDKLRFHANNRIKKNREYGTALYNIDAIKKDIIAASHPNFAPLSIEEQALKLALSKQEALPDIVGTLSFKLNFKLLHDTAEPLLAKEIVPTKPIQELLNDSVLQIWVKQGIGHHRDKRDTCAFCRQSLPNDIWDVLDSHFNKESVDLETSIDAAIQAITDEITYITGLNIVKSEQFYTEERSEFDASSKTLFAELAVYRQDLFLLRKALETRKNSLFQLVPLDNFSHDEKSIKDCADNINSLIAISNGRTKTLEKDKNSARNLLRLTDVHTFSQSINYDIETARIADLNTDFVAAETAQQEAESVIKKAEAQVSNLRSQQKDERKGAERVNSLLNHFFGHDGIKLEAKDGVDHAAVKFEITRNGESAYNLSEGECSLIAFCYFMAKLDDPDSKDKDLTIYIDDPISSLDGNHIFFMFSLIESLITKPVKNPDGSNAYRYKQLFISTHNLDFLKYLKRLSIPKKKVSAGENRTKSVDDSEHFLIERNDATSNILIMPSYLKDYITEFHYLFHQIYKCKNQSAANISHEPFFGFGNNLRKFLEAFLFFKYPYHDDINDSFERIKKFFGEEEDTAIALVNRLNNEFSHLAAVPDRGFRPVEIPEISKVANYVLDKIYYADPAQYNALLKSIGEPERAR